MKQKYPRMKRLWLDQGYHGAPLKKWVWEQLGWQVERTSGLSARTWSREDDDIKARKRGCKIQPRRWVVERTYAWLGRYRLLSKEYEATLESAEADIYIAMSRLMLRRIAKNELRQRALKIAA